MGLHHVLRLFKYADAAGFRAIMEQAAKNQGGFIEWDRPGEGNQDLHLLSNGDVHTVHLPFQSQDYLFSREMGAVGNLIWIELRIQDSSHWDYSLFRAAEYVDSFSTCIQYFEGSDCDAEVLREWQGSPQLLADSWGLPAERISRYLVNWGLRADDEQGVLEFDLKDREGTKAYPTDEHAYGDYEQFFDVLRVLGGAEPPRGHTIVLPDEHRHG